MYQTLRRTFFWPSMTPDAYQTVRQCSSCTRERTTLRKHATYLSLFPAQVPLEFVAIDILGPLPKTTDGHIHVLRKTDCCSKMVRTILLKNITAATVAKAFCEHLVFQYGPPAHLLSDNGGQFTAKFFQDCSIILGIRKLFKTAYPPQTNGQVERFNRPTLPGLRHFCSEHGRHRDRFSHAITFAYNNIVHRATGLTPLDPILTRPPKPLNLENVDTINPEALGPRQEKTKFSQRLELLMETADTRLKTYRARYKRDSDKRVRQFNTGLKQGDLVFVKRETANESEERNRAARGAAIGHQKLRSKATGPYQVVSVPTSTVTIMRGGLADKVSKDRVVRASYPIRQDNGEAVKDMKVNPANSTTPEEQPPSARKLTGSVRDAVPYPADRAIDNQAHPVVIRVPRRSSRETAVINPSPVLDSEEDIAVPSAA